MPQKRVTIRCPWCKRLFEVGIPDKYKDAEAIPQSGDLAKDVGHTQPCPNPKCEHQLFIRYLS
jgi:hypothetical protein